MVINILNSGVNSSGGGARKRWHRIAKATLQGKRSDRTRWSIGPRVTHPARAILMAVAGNVRTTRILILKAHVGLL